MPSAGGMGPRTASPGGCNIGGMGAPGGATPTGAWEPALAPVSPRLLVHMGDGALGGRATVSADPPIATGAPAGWGGVRGTLTLDRWKSRARSISASRRFA